MVLFVSGYEGTLASQKIVDVLVTGVKHKLNIYAG